MLRHIESRGLRFTVTSTIEGGNLREIFISNFGLPIRERVFRGGKVEGSA